MSTCVEDIRFKGDCNDKREGQIGAQRINLASEIRRCKTVEKFHCILIRLTSEPVFKNKDGQRKYPRFYISGKKPQGGLTFLWNGNWYTPRRDPRGFLSNTQEVIAKAALNKVKYFSSSKYKKLEEFLGRFSHDHSKLIGDRIFLGPYRFTDVGSDGSIKGAVILNLNERGRDFYALELSSAIGSFKWMEEKHKGDFITIPAAITGRINDRIPEEKKQFAKKLAVLCNRTLWPRYIERKQKMDK